MIQVDVTAQVRTSFGKGAARSLRRTGQTPAIIYGLKTDPIALSLDTRSFTKTLLELQRRNAVVNLEVEGGEGAGKKHVLIKEIQVDPIKDSLKHADFYEISLDVPSAFSVPVNYKGKAAGVDLGGELIVSLTHVSLQANPLDIPDTLELDISSLNIGDSISCKDIQLPANVTLLDDENKVCVAVEALIIAPVSEEDEAEA